MPTDFPGALDTFAATIATTDPTVANLGDMGSGVSHAEHHNDAEDAITALETKLGADGSADVDSHDFKLAAVASGDKAVSDGDVTAFAFSVLDDATQADAQTTLGLGTGDSPTFVAGTFTAGTVTVRAAGAGAGTKEAKIVHDGSNAYLVNNYGWGGISTTSGFTVFVDGYCLLFNAVNLGINVGYAGDANQIRFCQNAGYNWFNYWAGITSTGVAAQVKITDGSGGPGLGSLRLTWIGVNQHTAPADADLATGEMAIWFDQTSGAAKLKIKAKDSGGTVRTGEVALT
jgi:hypothetical protein